MRKLLGVLFTILTFISCGKQGKTEVENAKSIYNQPFSILDIYGNPFDINTLKGKKIMLVNTASKCGFTYQYEELEKLYQKYKDKNFVIIGFPANNFKSQEPGSDADILEFCQQNYGVSFPMMSKISVKGDDMHPFYQFLTDKNKNGVTDESIKWNFQKYLIDEKGRISAVYFSMTEPNDEKITRWIEGEE